MPPRTRRGADAGQATIEHAAIMLLVAALLGAAVLVADNAAARARIERSVIRQMARALCLVDGNSPACVADRTACVVSGDGTAAHLGVDLRLVRIGEGGLLAIEQLSDRRAKVTLINDMSASVSVGRTRAIALGAHHGSVDASVSAALAGTIGRGLTWTLPDAEAAARLVRRIRVDEWLPKLLQPVPDLDLLPPGTPKPTAVSSSTELSAAVRLALSRGELEGGLALDVDDVRSSAEDLTTGHRTVVLRGELSTAISEALTGLKHSSTLADSHVAVTFDRSGRPLELVRFESADVDSSADSPATVLPAAGYLGGEGARTVVVETHLELTSPVNREAAAAVLARARSGVPFSGAIGPDARLRELLERHGIVNARVYRTETDPHRIAVPGVGEAGKEFSAQTLVAAVSRGPDGSWYRSDACDPSTV